MKVNVVDSEEVMNTTDDLSKNITLSIGMTDYELMQLAHVLIAIDEMPEKELKSSHYALYSVLRPIYDELSRRK